MAGAPQPAPQVRAMFDRIAPTYDRANHWLSLSVDRYWRAYTVRRLARALGATSAPLVLDVCCGTGDLSLALVHRLAPGARVVGADFSREMLTCARAKAPGISWLQADGMRLPCADGACDAMASAFGFRNLSNYAAGLAEFYRLLRPGGVCAILEISQPVVPLLGRAYLFYFERVLPRLGGWISGDRGAYQYLPHSVARFPSPPELAAGMRAAGFTEVQFHRFLGGVAALHLARKPL